MLRRITTCLAPIVLFLAPSLAIASESPSAPPQAVKKPVTDTYWGQKVVDDYQYMESPGDSSVTAWAEAQNAYTRAWLDGHPDRAAILSRVQSLTHDDSPDYFKMTCRPGMYFLMKDQPPKQQPMLVVLTSVMDTKSEKVVVDPNALDPTGHTTIDFYVPSLDGKYVAVSLSENGTEDGTLLFFETATGRELSDMIPRVNGGTAGGSVAWIGDGGGVYYTRYPRKGERPDEDLPFYQRVYFHRLGAPVASDAYVVGADFPKIAETELSTSPDGKWVMADVSNGDGGEHAYWMRMPDGTWTQFAEFKDRVIEAHLGVDEAVYLLSRDGAPNRKILRLPLGDDPPDLEHATVVVPETESPIESYTPTATRIYVTEMVGGPTQLRVYSLQGKPIGLVTMPEVATISQAIRSSGDDVLVRSQSYTRPPAYYRYGPGMSTFQPTAIAQKSSADFSAYEVRREYATAKDGTKIPVNILMRRGMKRDGKTPALLQGYGSYGLSEQPYFNAARLAWLEQGGIWVDASVRGGGEYGDAWHDQARLGTKKVSMDDFAACAKYLVQAKYTRKERLAIEGGSAGGLLVYGTLVHYPGVVEAAVAHVGYGDVLRTETSPNGEFNTTEFGTVKDSVQFAGMYSYSPYHHVKQGVVYPSVLALTGLNDPRVASWETFKMVARLQAVGSPNPVFMRVTSDAGHGVGASLNQRDQRTTDVMVFLFDRLGLKYRPVTTQAKTGDTWPNG
jgi:prolyl oligopeptidase